MRSFQIIFWISFLLFYILATQGTYKTIAHILKTNTRIVFKRIYLSWGVFILLSLVLLYIWPGNVRSSENYSLYFYFNGVLFIDLVFKLPLSFLFLFSFLVHKKNRNIFSWVGVIISTCLILLLSYGIFIGRHNVVVKQVNLEHSNLPKSFNNYTILHLSDIHLGSFNHSERVLKNVIKQTNNIDPDLVIFTGDLVNNYSFEVEGWEESFQEINRNRNAFSILGNHDYGNYSEWKSEDDKKENFNAIIDAHKSFGFQLLRNENVKINIESDSIYLLGVENWGHPPFPQYADLEKAFSGVPQDAFKILLTHDPAHWESQIRGKKQIDLTLSGHTHGLQWGIMPAGVPLSFSYLVRKNWGGLYNWNDMHLYVNTGLGTVGTPWRMDMPAEITVINLKRIKVNGQ